MGLRTCNIMINIITICFVATDPARFLDQLMLANGMSSVARGDIKIILFIGEEVFKCHSETISNLPYEIISAREQGISQYHSRQKSIYNKIYTCILQYLPPLLSILIQKLSDFVKTSVLYDFKLISLERRYLYYLRNTYRKISALLGKDQIDLIFINGDRHLGYEPVFLKLSHDLNIKSVIPYLVNYSDEERLCVGALQHARIKHVGRSLLASRYILRSQGLQRLSKQCLYYYHHSIANALKKFGVLSDNPFVMGCGKSDILCLNDRHSAVAYSNRGVNSAKIRVLGDASYDKLFHQYTNKKLIKDELCNKYMISGHRKIAILSLPQLAEHGLLSWKEHWIEIEFLVETLCSIDQSVIISLHPKMEICKYKYLEAKYNCRIASERLLEIIPVADIFVSTYSSTVVWATLCGITAVIVDFYKLNYTFYDYLTTVKKVTDKKVFKSVLQDALNDCYSFSYDWGSLSRSEVFDGKTFERYVALAREVVGDCKSA